LQIPVNPVETNQRWAVQIALRGAGGAVIPMPEYATAASSRNVGVILQPEWQRQPRIRGRSAPIAKYGFGPRQGGLDHERRSGYIGAANRRVCKTSGPDCKASEKAV
jgi:hypothetical protein